MFPWMLFWMLAGDPSVPSPTIDEEVKSNKEALDDASLTLPGLRDDVEVEFDWRAQLAADRAWETENR